MTPAPRITSHPIAPQSSAHDNAVCSTIPRRARKQSQAQSVATERALRRHACALLSLALLAIPGAALATPEPDGFDLAAVRAQDHRLATITQRLASAAADQCAETATRPGWALHGLAQYSAADRQALAAALSMDRGAPSIFALADGGPAERAGLQVDDVIAAVDGVDLAAPNASDAANFAPLRGQLDDLDAAFARGEPTLTIHRKGKPLEVKLRGETVCAPRVQLILQEGFIGQADERTISVSFALASFTRNDDELAFVLAHELAHVILRHKAERLSRAADWTSQDKYAAELAADALATRLMRQARYSPRLAADFWRRLSVSLPPSPAMIADHPGAAERARALESE